MNTESQAALFQMCTPKGSTRMASVSTSVTGRKMPKGWLPSLNPHSLLQPPQTHGDAVCMAGWSTATFSLFSPCFSRSVTSSVHTVRPTSSSG